MAYLTLDQVKAVDTGTGEELWSKDIDPSFSDEIFTTDSHAVVITSAAEIGAGVINVEIADSRTGESADTFNFNGEIQAVR